ncbi:hypothetical protein WN982_10865 [Paraburkholderia sp. IMGN_8]|uniref:hypothetical protein n=1 Tax=Paraburkholderia sp. IMGN_8 TaxID=3136564 RepID=UPI0031019577
MTKFKIALVAFLGLLLGAPAFAQSSRELQRAFMKIDAQIETGINYRVYNVLVGDANLELKLYAASKEGVQHPQAIASFKSSLLQYAFAATLWERKLQGAGWNTISPTEPMYQGLLTSYPDATKSLKEGGAMFDDRTLSIEFLLPLIWQRAVEQSKLAMSLM